MNVKPNGVGGGFNLSLKGELVSTERSLVKGTIAILMIVIIYVILSTILMGEFNKKVDEVAVESAVVQQQKVAMANDKTRVEEKTATYTELIENLQEKAHTETEAKRLKYSVPTLLNKIMSSIPVNVQLTSIRITGTKVTITAQSDRYEQLGIFIAKLNQDGILVNVVSDTSNKKNEVVSVTIEGELP